MLPPPLGKPLPPPPTVIVGPAPGILPPPPTIPGGLRQTVPNAPAFNLAPPGTVVPTKALN